MKTGSGWSRTMTSQGALEASAHDQPRGKSVRIGAAANDSGEAVEAGGERNRDDLEAADGSGAELPEGECAGADAAGGGGCALHQRRSSAREERRGAGHIT